MNSWGIPIELYITNGWPNPLDSGGSWSASWNADSKAHGRLTAGNVWVETQELGDSNGH